MGRTTGRFHALFMSLTEFCLEQSKVTDMKIADNASIDDNTHGGGEIPPRTGLTPDALPEVQEPVLAENSQTGVSTRNALSGTDDKPSGEAKPALAIPRCEEGRANDSTTLKTIEEAEGSSPLVCAPCHIRSRKEGIRLFGRKACRGILSDNQYRQGSCRQAKDR